MKSGNLGITTNMKILITQKIIINKINSQLRSILNVHFKVHKLNDTIQQFQNLFCINNALAKIEKINYQF